MGSPTDSFVNNDGKCNKCDITVPEKELLQCEECKTSFHVMCAMINPGEKHCTRSFLNQYLTQSTKKPNFSWKCDPCTTCQDAAKKSDLAQIVHGLVLKVEALTTAFGDFKQETKQGNTTLANTLGSLKQDIKQDITSIQPLLPQPSTQGNPWANTGATQKLRSSFLVKPSQTGTADMGKINKIVSDNNLQVNMIGVSQKGHTFIHCPNEEASKKLQSHIQTELTEHVVHPLQDPLPTISITGVTGTQWNPTQTTTEGISNFTQKLRDQNPFLESLVSDGETLKVIFMKSPNAEFKNFQIVARVSPKIRDAITAHWNKLYIGATSVRVYDRFYVKRCNKCNRFGHYKDTCSEAPACGICGAEDHESEACNHKTDTSRHSCINCKRGNLQNTGHNATSPKCPAYLTAQKKIRGNTPYYQGTKNMFRHPRQ